MRGYVATTDYDWFTFLRARQPLDEVNFWQPSAHGFNAPPGTPFFFKLKKPHYKIGGFGIFARYEEATPELAWEAFGEKNGAPSYATMSSRIRAYAKGSTDRKRRVGCIMVSTPVFFRDDELVAQPADWQRNIVSGSGYDLAAGEGLRIWEECRARATSATMELTAQVADAPISQRYGAPQIIRPRLGQGTFRIAVTGAYAGACAVSGEHSLPVLEAAHIKPYRTDGTHEVKNGILLRADIHRLFDAGYVTITPERRFVVSRRLAEEWENGKAYYAMEKRQTTLPGRVEDHPSPELLRWHNDQVFERRAG